MISKNSFIRSFLTTMILVPVVNASYAEGRTDDCGCFASDPGELNELVVGGGTGLVCYDNQGKKLEKPPCPGWVLKISVGGTMGGGSQLVWEQNVACFKCDTDGNGRKDVCNFVCDHDTVDNSGEKESCPTCPNPTDGATPKLVCPNCYNGDTEKFDICPSCDVNGTKVCPLVAQNYDVLENCPKKETRVGNPVVPNGCSVPYVLQLFGYVADVNDPDGNGDTPFKKCCDGHDECYSDCTKKLHNRVPDCDIPWRACMEGKCTKHPNPSPEYTSCLQWAAQYYGTVANVSASYFKAAQLDHCVCCP